MRALGREAGGKGKGHGRRMKRGVEREETEKRWKRKWWELKRREKTWGQREDDKDGRKDRGRREKQEEWRAT